MVTTTEYKRPKAFLPVLLRNYASKLVHELPFLDKILARIVLQRTEIRQY